MKKSEKFYLLIFILSCVSLGIAIILKLCGVPWFGSAPITVSHYSNLEYTVNIITVVFQGFLIVGCMTWEPPKELIKKYIPFIPLNALLYFIPQYVYLVLNIIMLFAMALSVRPRFSTVIRSVFGIAFICLVRQASMWLKYNTFGIAPETTDAWSMIIGNIDQFIIFALYYYFNVKWGDKYAKLVIFRKDR